MTVLVLNTHEAIKRLVKAGQDEKSAEAIVELITDVHEQVATKHDVRSEIQGLENKILKLFLIHTLTIVGVMVAMFTFFNS